METALPYEGYGAATILSDGTLLIRAGGEKDILGVSDNDGETEEIALEPPYEVFAYQLDTTGLVLVQHGNDVFLDKGNKELTRRGLAPQQAFRLLFPDNAQIDPACPVWSIADFTGTLKLAFDVSKETRVLSIEVVDSGRVFTLAAPVVVGAASGGNDSLTLHGPRPYESEGASDCSVTCSKGSNSIHCAETGCKCWCKAGGLPTCECVTSTPWH